MTTRARIDIPHEAIAAFCRRWQITELSLFGSVLPDDFRPDSDVDVLVTFAPNASWRFEDLLDMEEELERILARKVDFIERAVVEESRNCIRRRDILASIEPTYVAR